MPRGPIGDKRRDIDETVKTDDGKNAAPWRIAHGRKISANGMSAKKRSEIARGRW